MKNTSGHIRRRALALPAAAASAALVLSSCSAFDTNTSEAGANYPSKPVTLTAPAEPGSGWDTTARALAETFDKEGLTDSALPVQNRTGATGCVWLNQMANDMKGDAYNIAVTSTPILSNYLRGDCDTSYKDVTMIASLIIEHYIVVTPDDAPYTSLDDLLAEVKDDPQSVPVAASGDDQLPFALLVKAYGGDPSKINFVQYEGGGEQITAMLNGDVTAAIAGVSEFRGQLESGDLRGLAVLSDEGLESPLDDIPTAQSLGYDVTLANTREIYGPPDMPATAVEYWQGKLKDALATSTWKKLAERNQWEPLYLVGDELDTYLKDANAQIEQGLRDTGAI